MKPQRKQRLLIVIFILAGVGIAVGLALFALNKNINLFYNPTQIAKGEAPAGQRIRAGGMVVKGSLQRTPGSLDIQFQITDFKSTIPVHYNGILPDLFREGQGIVAMGRMDGNGLFQAEEVLAKHDEKYVPPEVADALKKADMAGRAEAAQGAVAPPADVKP